MRSNHLAALTDFLATGGPALSHPEIISTCAAGALARVYTNANNSANGLAREVSDKRYNSFAYVSVGPILTKLRSRATFALVAMGFLGPGMFSRRAQQ